MKPLLLFITASLVSGDYIPLDALEPVPKLEEAYREQIGPKEEPPDAPSGFQKNGWGCKWFPLVDHADFLTRIVDKRLDKITVTWDTNGDNYWDVQFTYTITGYGAGGWVPISEPVPERIDLDLDYDHKRDIVLSRKGNGKQCKDWYSKPFKSIEGPKRPDCINKDCDRLQEGEM